jgi:TolB-like protein/Flp pilus assembly protein TadD
MDFGLARRSGVTQITKAGTTAGTIPYMSPEQTRGENIDDRTDIWSLGVVLYEMISGKLPFRGAYDQAIIYQILNDLPDPVSAVRSDIPDNIEHCIRRMLEKNPGDRYQSVSDLLIDIRRIKVHITKIEEEKHPAQQRISRPASSTFPTRTGVAILFLVCIVAAFLYIYYSGTPAGPTGRIIIAVLPFENLGPLDQEYFADGITEEIINRLSGISGLGVIARSSAMQYKGAAIPVRQIGEELGVGYILEGTVRWETTPDGENRVRISPQLINASDGTQIWSQPYDAVLTGIFIIQSDIAERVANSLDVVLLTGEKEAIEYVPTTDAEAYDYYLRALEFYNRSTDERDLMLAVQLLERAVELDSAFALAYSFLARVHVRIYWFHYDRSDERVRRAREAAERALMIAPDLAEAHIAKGWYYYQGELSYDGALQQFEIARKYQPDNADLLFGIAAVYRRQGKMGQFVEYANRALELNPRSVDYADNLARTYTMLREFDEAERLLHRTIFFQPGWTNPYVSLAYVFIRRDGDIDAARQIIEQAPAKKGTRGVWDIDYAMILLDLFEEKYDAALYRLDSSEISVIEDQFIFLPRSLIEAQIYSYMGRSSDAYRFFELARDELSEYLKKYPDDPRVLSSLGIALAGVGQKEEAIRAGREAVTLMPITKEAWRGAFRLQDLAHIYVLTGEYDLAMRELEKLLSMPTDLAPQQVIIDPRWKPLYEHPQFDNLMRKTIAMKY